MSVLSFLFQTGDWRITEGLRTIQYLYRTAHRPQLCSVSMAPAAVAKPHAVYALQGGTAAKYDMGSPQDHFYSPIMPDDAVIDPADENLLPWEEPVLVSGAADPLAGNDDDTFAASIWLEIGGSNNSCGRVGVPFRIPRHLH